MSVSHVVLMRAVGRSKFRLCMAGKFGPSGGRTGFFRFVLACCWFRGNEDKIVTRELESGYPVAMNIAR